MKTLIFEFWIWAFSNDIYFIAAFSTVWTYALLSLSFNELIVKFNCKFVFLTIVLSYTPETMKVKIWLDCFKMLTVSAQIERRRSIKIYYIFAAHIGKFWYKLSKKYSNFGQLFTKTDHSVPQKCILVV